MLTRIVPTGPLGQRDLAALELLYGCGLRASELVGLREADVDLEGGLVRCLGKGDKERVVPLGAAAANAVRRYARDGRRTLLRGRRRDQLLAERAGRAAHPAGSRLRPPPGPAARRPPRPRQRPHLPPLVRDAPARRPAPTCAACRRCSGTPRSRRRRSTRTSPSSTCARSSSRRTRGRGGAGRRWTDETGGTHRPAAAGGTAMTRVAVIVLDGVGAGALPDAAAYGDEGSNTLRHVLEATGVALPNLTALGLGEIVGAAGVDGAVARAPRRPTGACSSAAPARTRPPATGSSWGSSSSGRSRPTRRASRPTSSSPSSAPSAAACSPTAPPRARPSSRSSATSTSPAAAPSSTPRPTPSSRSPATRASSRSSGSTSGARVGAPDPRRANTPSAASSRGRSTASPAATCARERRRDFALPPTGPTYLDLLQERGVPVVGVGKIGEIFAQRGVDVDDHATNNADGLARLRASLAEMERGPAVRQPGRLRHGLRAPQRRRGLRPRARGRGRLRAAARGAAAARRRARLSAPTTASTRRRRAPTTRASTRRCWRSACAAGAATARFSDVGATAFAALTGEAPPLAGRPIAASSAGGRDGGAVAAGGARRRRRLRLRPRRGARRAARSKPSSTTPSSAGR